MSFSGSTEKKSCKKQKKDILKKKHTLICTRC